MIYNLGPSIMGGFHFVTLFFQCSRPSLPNAFKVPGLAEKRPSLVRGDRLIVRQVAADGTACEKIKYEGFVHHVQLDKVLLKFSPR